MEALPEVDLIGGDMESALRVWTATLALAARDFRSNARLQFRPDLGEDCLSVVVDQTTFEMIPPPVELRKWLLRAGRKLATGNTWYSNLWSWASYLLHRHNRGLVTLVLDGGYLPSCQYRWAVDYSPEGLVFQPVDSGPTGVGL